MHSNLHHTARAARALSLGATLFVTQLLWACADASDAPEDQAITPAVGSDAAAPAVRDAASGSVAPSGGDAATRLEAGMTSTPGHDAGVPGAQTADASGASTQDASQGDADLDAQATMLDSALQDAAQPDGAIADGAVADASVRPKLAKFVGNITTNGQVRSDFAGMWNQITPENEGKWGSVESVRNQMDWKGLDRAHTYARQNGILFKQHTMVWGSQQPSWLNGLSAADQAKEVEEWIRLFCERYPDVDLIDVVNEPPPHTTPVYMNALGGAGGSGYDWIVQAFKLTRKYCPKAILILNDYNTIEYANDNSRFITIAKAVKKAGAPIDALGAQAHAAYNLPTATVQGMLDKMASETGLPVYITEYDINLADDTKQRQVMESQFTMFWRDKNVKGITLWGYVSGATWVANSGLMSSAGKHRPALDWLLTFLKNEAGTP